MASEASTNAPDSPQPRRVKQAEMARILGVKRSSINGLLKTGKLIIGSDGLIDVEAARMSLMTLVHPRHKSALAAAVMEPLVIPTLGMLSAPSDAETPPDDAQVSESIMSYHVAKTLRESAEAQMAQLELREKQGELIMVLAVERVWAEALASTREHLLQVRARLAPLLAFETDVFKVEQILESEHSKALQFLAGAAVT